MRKGRRLKEEEEEVIVASQSYSCTCSIPGCAMATTESLYYWNCALNLGDRDEEELPSRLVQLSRSFPPNIHVRAVPTAPPHSTGGEG